MDLLTMLVDFSEKLKRGGNFDYELKEIPCQLDDEIRSLTDLFLRGTDLERELISSCFNDSHSMTFIVFSERMASLAVRKSSREILLAGLIAQVIEGWRFDPRANLMRLSLILHSAVNLGIELVELFSEASKYASQEVADYFQAFLRRRPENQSIEVMGYRESTDADGFRYDRIR
ncbi:MAG: hypothetical protein L0387_43420 [Acidobacteria bacterium]|nr:hypothetical protein [Acidobacteriota bacterium]